MPLIWLRPGSGGRELTFGPHQKIKNLKIINHQFLPFLIVLYCDILTTEMAPPIINIEFMKDRIQQWYLTNCETISYYIGIWTKDVPKNAST
jgi:hypothetical protein